MKLTNDADLLIRCMGKLFKVTHICNTTDEANAICASFPNNGKGQIGVLCEDEESGKIFIAEEKEVKPPSFVELRKLDRHSSKTTRTKGGTKLGGGEFEGCDIH